MAKISINDFKVNFNGGTRENRFLVEGSIPYAKGKISRFHIKTTQIPSLSTVPIEYGYFGRKAYYPGEKQYQTWSMRIIDDTGKDGNLWKMFHTWHNRINEHKTNKSETLSPNKDYKAYGWKIHHLNLNGDESRPLKTFILNGCWPKVVDSVLFSMTNPNALNEFTVVFLYDYLEIKDITARV